MAWAAAAVGGLSAVGGIMGSRSAKKQQREALKLQREQLQFQKDRYNRAVGIYDGLERKVADQAMEGVKADLGGVSDRAAGDIALQFQGANEAALRDQQRMGINPNSGRAESQMRRSRLTQALATAGGITAAREGERRNAEQQTWDRRFATSQVGVNQMNGTASNVGSSMNGLSNTMMGIADQNQAAASALLGSGGQLIGGALAKKGLPATETTTPTAGGSVSPTLGTQPAAKVMPSARVIPQPSLGLPPLQSTPLGFSPVAFD